MRNPSLPPFPVGTRLRYLGTREAWSSYGGETSVRIIGPGMEVTIDAVKLGRRGTGEPLYDLDGPMIMDDTGEPVLDETRDGYSAYHVEGLGRKHGRLIYAKDADEWEVLK